MSHDFPPDSASRNPELQVSGEYVQQEHPPVPASQDPREWALPVLLFLITFLSTSFAGLFYSGDDLDILSRALAVAANPAKLLQGLPFSFTFMTILLAHEMGHYLACRHYGIRCTPPFFIPFPITFVGTLGAFIRIKAPFRHKRALFDVGIAGPLAGFAFVVPALIIGISRSRLGPKLNVHGLLGFGEPLLFRWLGNLLLGYAPDRQDMFAHPVAMAAWWGLLATSLNLFPIWQLDGGHISYALVGRAKQKTLSIGAVVALMLVSLIGWQMSYLFFAGLLLFFGMRFRFYHPPTLDDAQELGPGRVALGILAFLILAVSFTPVPIFIS